MARKHSVLAAALFASALVLSLSSADATTVLLQNVTFKDGGTASGSFDLNVYSYLDGVDLTTFSGSILGGYDYVTGGLLYTPPSTAFYFNSSSDFSLVLDLSSPLGVNSSNFDAVIPGSVNGATLSGSYEICSSVPACGFGQPVYRLISSGTTYAPEPATLGLLGFGAATLAGMRCRRRVGGNGGVA